MSYNSFSPISEQDTTIFTKGWTNDVTRLNADNMNKLTDRVKMISSALLDSDGHGIIEEVNKFNDVLRDHHSAISNIGSVYREDSIQYKINLNDTSYSHSIAAKSTESGRNYFEITASGGVDIACGNNNVAVSITPDDTTIQSLSVLTSGIVNSTSWEQNESIVNVGAVKSKVIGDSEDNIIDNNTNNIDSTAPLTLCGLRNAIEHYAVRWQSM